VGCERLAGVGVAAAGAGGRAVAVEDAAVGEGFLEACDDLRGLVVAGREEVAAAVQLGDGHPRLVEGLADRDEFRLAPPLIVGQRDAPKAQLRGPPGHVGVVLAVPPPHLRCQAHRLCLPSVTRGLIIAAPMPPRQSQAVALSEFHVDFRTAW